MEQTSGPRFDRSGIALLTGLAVDNFGAGLFLPLALVYATRVVGLEIGIAGPAVGLAAALGLAVPPVAGRLTHRFGPRASVVTSQLVQAAGALAYLLAEGVAGVFVGAGLMAVGLQLFYCSVFVLIADVSADESKERPFARVGMVRAAAFGSGALVAALVLAQGTVGLRWVVQVTAATYVVAAVVLARFVVTDPVDHEATTAVGPVTVLRDRRYLSLMTAVSLLALTLDVALVGVPVYVLDVLEGPAWLPGALIAMGTALSSVLGVKVVDLLRGVRRTRSLQAAAALYALFGAMAMGAVWLPEPWIVPYFVTVWLLLVAANKVFYPIAGALSEALPPRGARAGYMATFQYSFTATQVLSPAVVGLFAVSHVLPWIVVATAALLGVLVLDRLGRTLPDERNRSVAVAIRA